MVPWAVVYYNCLVNIHIHCNFVRGFLSQLLNCSYAKASLSCSVVKGFLEGTYLSINDTILLYVDRV